MDSKSVLLTVITPVFNDSQHIFETVGSVLEACSEISFQYLVVDDGSTDGTRKILESFGDKITYIQKQNGGQASAINLGLQFAIGKYSSIVNSDDPIPKSGLFERSLELLEKEPKIVGTYPDWSIINNNGEIIKRIQVPEYSIEEMYGNFNCLVGPGGVFKTDLAKKILGWDSSYKYVPDYDFWLKLAQFGEFRRIPQNLALWRQHAQSISVKSRSQDMALERIRVISNHQYRLSSEPSLNRRALANAYLHAAILIYFDSSIPGRKWAAKAVRISPSILIKKKKAIWIFLFTYPISKWLLKIVEKLGLRSRL